MSNVYKYLIHLVCLISSDLCSAGKLTVLKGDIAKLDFPYPCDSTAVTLQRSNGRPFYSSANPDVDSLPSRYEVRKHTDSNGDICYLNLIINPVSGDDEGTFILMAYKDGQMLPDLTRIWLDVDYPPGKASCESNNEYVDGEWVKLYCQASMGAVAGQIVCYQDDMRLPSLTSPEVNGDKLNQKIWARLAGLVYCCTSTFQQTKDRCECNDFKWNPILNTELNNIPDPCAAATEMANSATTFIQQDQEISTIHANDLDKKIIKYTHNSCNRGFYVFITFICLMALGYFSLPILLLYKARQKKKKKSKKQSDTRNEDEPHEQHELNEIV